MNDRRIVSTRSTRALRVGPRNHGETIDVHLDGPTSGGDEIVVGGGTGEKTLELRRRFERFGHSFACLDVDVAIGGACSRFDGDSIPRHDSSQDIVFFSYSLHHAGEHTLPLLQEAARVARTTAPVRCAPPAACRSLPCS